MGGACPRWSPGPPTLYRASLVATYGTLGVLLEQANQLDQARAALNRSREIGEALVHDHPTVLTYHSDLGKTYLNLSVLESRADRPGDAVALLEPARESLRKPSAHGRAIGRPAKPWLPPAATSVPASSNWAATRRPSRLTANVT